MKPLIPFIILFSINALSLPNEIYELFLKSLECSKMPYLCDAALATFNFKITDAEYKDLHEKFTLRDNNEWEESKLLYVCGETKKQLTELSEPKTDCICANSMAHNLLTTIKNYDYTEDEILKGFRRLVDRMKTLPEIDDSIKSNSNIKEKIKDIFHNKT
jgi:hypothetical protein